MISINTPRFSFYKGPIRNTQPSNELSITELHGMIISDTYKDDITAMRSMTEDECNKMKEKLDYVTPAGIFEVRKDSGLLEISGYAPIDIDKIGADVSSLKLRLKGDNYICLLFISPSGRGLKAIIKVPADIDYSKYVEAFYSYLAQRYSIDDSKLDKKTRDISRACFLSYDTEAFLNTESKVFDKKLEEQPVRYTGIARKPEGWVEDFLLKYCTQNRLPTGERHSVIEKNLAALIRDRPDRDTIISEYQKAQGQGNFNGWLSDEKYHDVNTGEITKYIKRYSISFTIPEPTEIAELKKAVALEMAQKKTQEATEIMVQYFLEHNRIYTTRDDLSSEVWIYSEGIYVPQGKTYITEFVRDITANAFTTYLCNQVIAKIEADTFIDQEIFFNSWDKTEVIVLNGILNLETRELTSFTPDKIFFNKIPIIYDPSKDCPVIDAHFHEVLKFPEDVPVMYEIFGFLLWKDYFIEKAVMLSGTGRNGKGKSIELMKNFIGIENTANISLQDLATDRFAKSELFNKMANLAGDISSDALKNTSIFKGLTGRDDQQADRKFLSRVKFKNHAKMIFSANTIPRTHDTTPAFWNRWVLLEFPYTFLSEKEQESADPNLIIKLADTDIVPKMSTPPELSGLLNRALDGLDRIRKQGDFSYSKNTEMVRRMWIMKSDSFSAFISDRCEPEYDSYVKKDILMEEYSKYCKEENLTPMGDRIIKNAMEGNGYWESRKTEYDDDHDQKVVVRVWNGLKLKEKISQLTIGDD